MATDAAATGLLWLSRPASGASRCRKDTGEGSGSAFDIIKALECWIDRWDLPFKARKIGVVMCAETGDITNFARTVGFCAQIRPGYYPPGCFKIQRIEYQQGLPVWVLNCARRNKNTAGNLSLQAPASGSGPLFGGFLLGSQSVIMDGLEKIEISSIIRTRVDQDLTTRLILC